MSENNITKSKDTTEDEDGPVGVKNARLCHVMKWDNFDGYGFNLHAEKGKPGQYVGKVDDGSPAAAAGLRQGDRILQVNGETIGTKTHRQVVELIKSRAAEAEMLVVMEAGGTPASLLLVTADEQQMNKQNSLLNGKDGVKDQVDEGGGGGVVDLNGPPDITKTMTNGAEKEKLQQQQQSEPSPPANGGDQGILNLNMTAAELRAKLANRKKYDPKKETMDFKKKFDIVQKL